MKAYSNPKTKMQLLVHDNMISELVTRNGDCCRIISGSEGTTYKKVLESLISSLELKFDYETKP